MVLPDEFMIEGINDIAADLERRTEERGDARRDHKAEALARLKAAADALDAERAIDGLPPVDRAKLKSDSLERMRKVARSRGLFNGGED